MEGARPQFHATGFWGWVVAPVVIEEDYLSAAAVCLRSELDAAHRSARPLCQRSSL